MAIQYVQYPNPSVAISPTSEFFLRNGVNQAVTEDTVTPANNRPFPVKITGPLGDVTQVNEGGGILALATDVKASALPTGAATSANQTTANTSLASIDGKLASLGQKNMAGSAPVVISSDQSAIPSSQSGTWNITNVSGTVSLPTGASTSANQATEIASLASIDGKLGSLGQKNMAGSAPVVISSDQSAIPVSQSGTWNITNVSGTVSLPTGAATSANQTTANTSLASIDGKLGSLGQKTMAGSAPVVIASDQAAIPVSRAGRAKVNLIRNDYSSVNVTTAAYVQLVASTASAINRLSVFDSSGQTLVLAVGAAASEVDQFYIFPGGNGDVELSIPASSRISVKAVSATASVGELDINTFS